MEKPRGCDSINVDESKYSSFVPVIGGYIAVVSVVCFLALLYDILSYFRHKKRWLPCQLFSLNSLSLTILAIATKLPVDLTTSMPSALDQSSKLSGNCLICIAMGFLLPSIGTKQKEESLNHMLALSILVITVVVNTCVQIRTGVIFFFVAEHVFVICCMLAVLVPLWGSFYFVADGKALSLDHNKNCFTKGKGSMLQRLKLVYMFGFSHSPQFLVSVDRDSCIVAELCIICSVVLIQAVSRSISLKFCGGSSVYGWSVWVIVWVQVLTVVVGSLATATRSLGLSAQWNIDMGNNNPADASARSDRSFNPLLKVDLWDICANCLGFLLGVEYYLVYCIIFLPYELVHTIIKDMFHLVFKREHKEDRDIEKYKKRIAEEGEKWSLPDRHLVECMKDMKMVKTTSKSKSVENLLELLRRTSPSRPFHTMNISEIFRVNETLNVSSLSVVVLVRIAQVLLPSQLSDSLVQAYSDANEILHFVEDRIKSASIQQRRKSEISKALWKGRDFRTLLRQAYEESQFDSIFSDIKSTFRDDLLREEALMITKFIKDGISRPTEPPYNLSGFIQQLFVDMLHMFLTPLPHAVYKEVIQSTAEGFYESVKVSLGILWRIKSLETQVRWSFPVECDMRDLIKQEPQDIQLQVFSTGQEQEQDDVIYSHVVEDPGNHISATLDDDVIVLHAN